MRQNIALRILWRSRKIRTKLLTAFALISIILTTAIGSLSYFNARDALQNEAFKGIEALRETQASQIQAWMASRQRDVQLLAENPDVVSSSAALKNAMDTSNAYGDTQEARVNGLRNAYLFKPDLNDDVSEYGATHARFHPFYQKTRAIYEYDDILIVANTGRVVYSVQKQIEFATNLLDTPDAPLTQIFVNALNQTERVVFTDFIYYEPSQRPIAFFATPIFRAQNLQGILIMKVPIDGLNALLSQREGLGNTGETYIVGSDSLFRTDSRFLDALNVSTTILNPDVRVDTDAIRSGLDGNSQTQVIRNYRNIYVVSAWRPLYLDGGTQPIVWIVIVEKENAEIIQPANDLLTTIIFISITAMIIVLSFAYWISQQISMPIQELTQVAEKIRTGNFGARAHINNTDEVGILSGTFNEMTDQLAQSIHDLQEANVRAIEGSRLKSEFLSTISHELRTPLNAIEGYTGILLMGMNVEITEQARYMIERIEANSHRLLALINQILDVSRIEAGRLEIQHQPFSIHQKAGEWNKRMDGLAKQKNLTFTVYIEPDFPEIVYGDEEAITKITNNLLSNAFKFTHIGGITLNIYAQNQAWYIRVTDTGIGIPRHAQRYIFDEFRQVDGSSNREYGGTGLGLSIVKKLCTAMGGSIEVQSEINKGSTFIVTLPLHLEPRESTHQEEKPNVIS